MADASAPDGRLIRRTTAHRGDGAVTGYTSSLATQPAVWFGVEGVDQIDPTDPAGNRVRRIDSAVVLLTLRQARMVREDLDALIEWMEGSRG